LAQIQSANPDIRHARSDERGYTLLDIRAERLTAQYRTTPHPARAEAPLGVQASWVVQHGVAGVQAGS
jgi:alkaline phosphatase D